MNTYTVGTEVEIDATFKDIEGTLVDPTNVAASIRLPDGTVMVNLVVTRVSLGVYRTLFTPSENGLHAYRFAGTGFVEAASEGSFMAQTTFPT